MIPFILATIALVSMAAFYIAIECGYEFNALKAGRLFSPIEYAQAKVAEQYTPQKTGQPVGTGLDLRITNYRYWETDDYGTRLWNGDRQNLALVLNNGEWRVFTSHLRPTRQGHELIERGDLFDAGIVTDMWGVVIGQASDRSEAMTDVMKTLAIIEDIPQWVS